MGRKKVVLSWTNGRVMVVRRATCDANCGNQSQSQCAAVPVMARPYRLGKDRRANCLRGCLRFVVRFVRRSLETGRRKVRLRVDQSWIEGSGSDSYSTSTSKRRYFSRGQHRHILSRFIAPAALSFSPSGRTILHGDDAAPDRDSCRGS